jgi:hypothetical protein
MAARGAVSVALASRGQPEACNWPFCITGRLDPGRANDGWLRAAVPATSLNSRIS